VDDPRVQLCEVRVEGGELRGVAQGGLEPRLAAFAREHGLSLAVHFPNPEARFVAQSRLTLHRDPAPDAETVSEARYGEQVAAFDASGAYVRVATARDGYIGWVRGEGLAETRPEPTHRFTGLRGHVFAGPKVSAPRLLELSYGAPLRVLGTEGDWVRVALPGEGYVRVSLLYGVGTTPPPPTPEAVTQFALRFLETPYVWGGVTAWGLDCSGLVQTVYGAFGVALPRDADQQEACGEEVAPQDVRAGDLLFFPGHVAIALGATRFVHANAHHMRVTVDDFAADAYGGGLREKLTSVRRLL